MTIRGVMKARFAKLSRLIIPEMAQIGKRAGWIEKQRSKFQKVAMAWHP
jgi:hypothetical protein